MKHVLLAPVLLTAALSVGCSTTIVYEGQSAVSVTGQAPAPKPKPRLKKDVRAVLTGNKIEIKEMVQFELNRSVIRPESFELLNDVSQVMKEHPEIKKLAIEGHASSDGDDQANLLLSDARSKAVMAYMVSKGIDQKRLTAEGFGEKRPIADNNTEEGRIKNRRVEFNVVERDTIRTVETPKEPKK